MTSISTNNIINSKAKIGEKEADHDKVFPEHDENQFMKGADFHLDFKPTCYGGEFTPTSMWKFTNVQLVHTVTEIYRAKDIPCTAEVEIMPSKDDPWIELKPKKILGAIYRDFDIRLMGNVLDKEYGEDEMEKIMPYLYTRYDNPIFTE